jgi:hypothetical protein
MNTELTLEQAIKNVDYVVSNFRGTVNGVVLSNIEHNDLRNSFITVIKTLNMLQNKCDNLEKQLEDKNETAEKVE